MDPSTKPWTLLTNHARVLAAVARDPDSRIRDIADQVGITEARVQGILAELDASGYLTRTRTGRRTHYIVHPDQPHGDLPGPVGALLDLLTRDDRPRRVRRQALRVCGPEGDQVRSRTSGKGRRGVPGTTGP